MRLGSTKNIPHKGSLKTSDVLLSVQLNVLIFTSLLLVGGSALGKVRPWTSRALCF